MKKYIWLLAVAIILAFIQFSTPNIIGYDGYSNIHMAEVIKEEGFVKDFRWAVHTTVHDSFSDIQFGFKVLLIPFTIVGLMLGAKIAALLFALIGAGVFWWFLEKYKIENASLWTVVYLFSSVQLLYRFMLPRQMGLIIAIFLLFYYCMDKRKYIWTMPLTALFVWIHPSFVFLLPIMGIFVFLDLLNKKFDYRSLYPLIGIMVGLVVNPYFPSNISQIYFQIFSVNTVNLYNYEWRAFSLMEFVLQNWVFVGLVLVGLSKFRMKKNQIASGLIMLMFFVLMIGSRRMQEYFAPFAVIFFCFCGVKFSDSVKKIGVIVLLVIAGFGIAGGIEHIKNNDFLHRFDNCVEWLKDNAEEDSLVFNNAYTFNYLFFNNPELRYTHGLDLTYSYLYDKEEFERYMGVLRGEYPEQNIVVEDYNADYVFVGKITQDVQLFKYLDKHIKDFDVGYSDKSCAVLRVK